MSIKGSCLCGQVRFAILGETTGIGQCHCSRCRKVSGSAHAATLHVAAVDFEWLTGEEQVRTFVTDNGYTAAFCSGCGSPMPRERGTFVSIPAGCLDDDPRVKVAFNAFVSVKAPWSQLDESIPQFARKPNVNYSA